MRKTATLLSLLAFLLPALWQPVFAQGDEAKVAPTYEFDETGKTLLWEISGKSIKSPSFLYGTIHIQDKRVFCLRRCSTTMLRFFRRLCDGVAFG